MIIRDKEWYYIKGSIIKNTKGSKTRTHLTSGYQNIRQKMIDVKAEIENFTIVYGEIGLLIIDRSSRHKISKDTVDLNRTINQVNIIDMYRILYPTTESYTFS